MKVTPQILSGYETVDGKDNADDQDVLLLEDVWAAIGSRYGLPRLAPALLAAQDQGGADVSLLLLLDYLEQAGHGLSTAAWAAVLEASDQHQQGLRRHRAHRRSLKGRAGYEVAKADELALEKQALAAYISRVRISREISDLLGAYARHLGDMEMVSAAIDLLRQSRSSGADPAR